MQLQKETVQFFNNQREIIEKKSFKKTAFLGIIIGLTLASGLSFFNYVSSYFEKQNMIEKQQQIEQEKVANIQFENNKILETNNRTLMINTIKNINETQFYGLINYSEAEQSFYDSRVTFISKILAEAQAENTGRQRDVLNSNNTNRELNDIILNYKKDFESKINSLQNIYVSVQSGQTNHIKTNDLNNFIETYNKYSIGLPERVLRIENNINDILFTNLPGNLKYNEKNKVVEQAKVLEAEAIQNIKKTKVKP